MTCRERYDALPEYRKKQITDFMEYGLGRNGVDRLGVGGYSTLTDLTKYLVFFILLIYAFILLDKNNLKNNLFFFATGLVVLSLCIIFFSMIKKSGLWHFVGLLLSFEAILYVSAIQLELMGNHSIEIFLSLNLVFSALGIVIAHLMMAKDSYVINEEARKKQKSGMEKQKIVTGAAGIMGIVAFTKITRVLLSDNAEHLVFSVLMLFSIALIAVANGMCYLKIYYHYKYGLKCNFDMDFDEY